MSNQKREPIILDKDYALDLKVEIGLGNIFDDRLDFYHIKVTDDIIKVEKQGYNTPALNYIEYDTRKLIVNDKIDQKKDVIRTIYAYIFYKTGDLYSRVSTLERNPIADDHIGSNHAFYHDRTGKYAESEIAKAIKATNLSIFNERRF